MDSKLQTKLQLINFPLFPNTHSTRIKDYVNESTAHRSDAQCMSIESIWTLFVTIWFACTMWYSDTIPRFYNWWLSLIADNRCFNDNFHQIRNKTKSWKNYLITLKEKKSIIHLMLTFTIFLMYVFLLCRCGQSVVSVTHKQIA